jgi:GNAT superfamily N-acetyltransferase
MKLRLREMSSSDFSFIMATWLRGLYYDSGFYSEIDKAVFFDNYAAIAKAILEKSQCRPRIAVLEDDPNVILGYAILEEAPSGDIVHYVYVKSVFRKAGIAKQLLHRKVIACTHLTELGNSIRKQKNISFNPFLC